MKIQTHFRILLTVFCCAVAAFAQQPKNLQVDAAGSITTGFNAKAGQTFDLSLASITLPTATSGLFLAKANNLSDLPNAATARTNLGLGTLATQSGTFTGTHSGTSSGTNTGDQTTITGNAGSATVLQTARTINGVSFNGSASITVPAAGSTLTDTVTIANGGTGETSAAAAFGALKQAATTGATGVVQLAADGGTSASTAVQGNDGRLPNTLAAGKTGGTNQATALSSLGVLYSQTVTKTADYTIVAGDRGKLVVFDTTLADITCTMPAPATVGDGFTVAVTYFATSGSHLLTVGGFTLDDYFMNASFPMLEFISNGTRWFVTQTLAGNNGTLYSAANATVSVDFSNGVLLYSDGVTEIANWMTQVLNDTTQTPSVDWAQRDLFDDGNVTSVDWAGRHLVDSGGNDSILWGNRILRNAPGNAVLDWSGSGIFRPRAAAATSATTGTMTVTMTTSVVTITPTGDCTFNASGGTAGDNATFIVTTSGATSRTLTFGTNFKSTGTLATGVTTAKTFSVSFICKDGTAWVETSRTTAM